MNFEEIKLRDKWDCMVSFVRDPDGPFKMDVVDIQEAVWEGELKSKKSPEWFAKFLRADGVFTKRSVPSSFESGLVEFEQWMRSLPKFTESAYSAHSARFYGNAYNVPASSHAFVGRDDELTEIHDAFQRGRSDGQRAVLGPARSGKAFQAVVVHGKAPDFNPDILPLAKLEAITTDQMAKMRRVYHSVPMIEGVRTLKGFGGQGKTALAKEYAKRYRDEYAGIAWLDAAKYPIEKALFDFASTHLSEQVRRSDKTNQISRLSEYLRAIARQLRGRILIIIDDVPADPLSKSENSRKLSPIFKILQAVPPEADGRIDFLLTSRKEFHPERTFNMPINRLTAIDAANLFRERADRDDLNEQDPLLVRLVDKILGGHALSITLLASLAREQKITDLATLIEMIEGRIVEEGGILESIGLGEEYTRSLSATLSLAFKAVSPTAKYLLMVLGLFRRVDLTVETIKLCARKMPAEFKGAATELIRAELGRAGGRYKAIEMLVAHGLVERVGKGVATLGKVRLHEIIYDFVQATWGKVLKGSDQEEIANLRDLELSLTTGACDYASERINEEAIRFVDVETLIGFLLPIIRRDRGIVPDMNRVRKVLSFWFDHFKFQNYIYDVGLQGTIIGQAEDLHIYLTEEKSDDERFFLVLEKIIAHGHYSDPLGKGGKIATRYFNEGLARARAIEFEDRYVGQRREIQWYKVFLLNHRSNLATKSRPSGELADDVRSDPAIKADLDEIEATFPAALKSMDGPPDLPDCELLVRAGIYWGHRGNQDNYVLYTRLIRDDLRDDWGKIVADAHYFYKFAAHLRLMTLSIFRKPEFKDYIAPLLKKRKIPFVVPWLSTLKSESRVGFEVYTSLSQAIGDTAHQYRHYHFVSVLAFFGEKDNRRRHEIFNDAKIALDAADILWNLSAQRLEAGESTLIYRTWMASSHVLHEFMEKTLKEEAFGSLDSYLDQVDQRLQAIEGGRGSYAFAADQLKKQLEGVFGVVQNGRSIA